jgi:hypothetical protein
MDALRPAGRFSGGRRVVGDERDYWLRPHVIKWVAVMAGSLVLWGVIVFVLIVIAHAA